MTAPGKGSRWGAFLSSAFEGVENRLDNLLDEEQQAAQPPQQYEHQQGMKAAPPVPSPSPKPAASGASPPSAFLFRSLERLSHANLSNNSSCGSKAEPDE
jgi:hypothetical protein